MNQLNECSFHIFTYSCGSSKWESQFWKYPDPEFKPRSWIVKKKVNQFSSHTHNSCQTCTTFWVVLSRTIPDILDPEFGNQDLILLFGSYPTTPPNYIQIHAQLFCITVVTYKHMTVKTKPPTILEEIKSSEKGNKWSWEKSRDLHGIRPNNAEWKTIEDRMIAETAISCSAFISNTEWSFPSALKSLPFPLSDQVRIARWYALPRNHLILAKSTENLTI